MIIAPDRLIPNRLDSLAAYLHLIGKFVLRGNLFRREFARLGSLGVDDDDSRTVAVLAETNRRLPGKLLSAAALISTPTTQ
jgi:hypothetical protein